MLSALKQFGITRLAASLVFGAVLLGCMYGFHRGWSSDGYRVPGALDLSGEWEFYNGKYSPYEALAMPFYLKVEVPKPLPPEIKAKLAEEFWYRKRFKLPKVSEPLAISLGSIKGEHEVYWNGHYLGAGERTGFAVYRVPVELMDREEVSITVRVKKYDSLFPGIVHLNSVLLGNAEFFTQHQTVYYFEQGLKPILSGILKLFFAFLFIALFLATPIKREYLPFALFALFSAANAASSSKFLPFYEEYYFKKAIQFFFGSISLAMIPILTSSFLRLKNEHRSIARCFGLASALVFLSATFLVKGDQETLSIYRMANEWLPILVGLPSILLSAYCFYNLDQALAHRRFQIILFSASLLVGITIWSSFATMFYSFKLVTYFDFLDALIFVGLGGSLVLDFRVVSRRSEKAGKTIPKWFSGFLAAGTKQVQFEIPMLVIAVDTIGYTKKLAGLSAERQDQLHGEIRSLLMPLTQMYGAQKLSDGGDGGLFGWDMPVDEKDWQEVLNGVSYIAKISGFQFGVNFRVGVAAGSVRCEMRGADISFMGEALNTAARLESMSKAGFPLVDGSVAELVSAELLTDGWEVAELKGVVYRGRALKIAG